MILADSSVWIDHINRPDAELSRLLARGQILMHPFVLGEIALGNLANRRRVIGTLSMLRGAVVASHGDVFGLIHRHQLFGVGIGYVDAHLLGSVLITGETSLWTRDRRLRDVAERLGVAAAAA